MKLSGILKNPLITGTLLMTAAGVISRIIGFFYRIFLSRAIGAEALGIYQLVTPVFMLCFALTASSIQTSISKFVGDATGQCEDDACGAIRARIYLFIGLLLSCALAILTGLVIHQNAGWIAAQLLGESRCAPLLVLLSYSLLPSCIHACVNGYYYGKKHAFVPSLCQLAEQFARVGSVWLMYHVLVSQQKPLTEWHAIMGMVLGECVGLLVCLSAYATERHFSLRSYLTLKDSFPKMTLALTAMIVPLTANRLLVSLSSSLENLLIPQKLQEFGYSCGDALSIFGILTGMTIPIILFPGVLTNSFSVLLLPSVSEAKAACNRTMIRRTIRRAILYGSLLGLAFTALFFLSGDWIGNHLYKNALSGMYIKRLSFLCPLMYITSLLGSVMHGLNMAKKVLCVNMLSCLIRISMIWFLMPFEGIGAYLWGILLSQIFTALSCIILLRPEFK